MKLRQLAVGLLALLGVVGILYANFRPDRALRSATAAVADVICAKSFVSGLDPQIVFAETMERPGLKRLRAWMRYQIDRDTALVDASLMGFMRSRSAFHPGFGCSVLHGTKPSYLPHNDIGALRRASEPPALPEIAGPEPVTPSDPALVAALDHAFEEPATPPFRRTKAVVVIKDGRVIAERYAPGIGVDSQLLGFSLTKSVTNALLGILVGQGRLTLAAPAPVGEWRDATDPRHAITLEQMMRMTTGLALDETNSGFDASSQMILFRDMAGFAAPAPLMAPPGTRWAYSSATTQLLSRIIRDAAGSPEQAVDLIWRELLNPLGMHDVTVQFDGSGTMQGYANMLASARDWGRFGLLYLNDGVAGTRRILPEGWVALSAKATLDTDYGAGLWTNRSRHPQAMGRAKLGIPEDAFFMFGLLGQRVMIMPTQRIVVVRLGDSIEPDGDIRGVARLVRDVIAATAQPAVSAK